MPTLHAANESVLSPTIDSPPPLQATWNGSDYSNHSEMQFDSIHALIEAQDWKKCKTQQRVLDIGCGDGKLTAEIAARLPQSTVLGIDLSPAMIAFSQARHRPRHPNLSFETIDVQALPERFNNTFDTVTSFYCLHWIKNLHPAFNAIYRCLRPTGQIIFYFAGSGETPVLHMLEDLLISQQDKATTLPRVYRHRIEDVIRTAKTSGFTIDHGEEFLYPYTYKNKEALQQWVAALPYATESSQTERLRYINTAIDLYLQRFPANTDGSITLNFALIRLYAHKQ